MQIKHPENHHYATEQPLCISSIIREHRTQELNLLLGRKGKHLWLTIRQLPMKTGWWDALLVLRDLAEAISVNIEEFENFPNRNYDTDLKIKTVRVLHCNPIECLKFAAHNINSCRTMYYGWTTILRELKLSIVNSTTKSQ